MEFWEVLIKNKTVPKKSELYTIQLNGDIHEENAAEVSEVFEDAIQNERFYVAVDCSNLEYLYSVGIRVLLKYQKFFKLKGGAIYLYNLSSRVQKILNEINLLEFLNGYETRDDLYDVLEE